MLFKVNIRQLSKEKAPTKVCPKRLDHPRISFLIASAGFPRPTLWLDAYGAIVLGVGNKRVAAQTARPPIYPFARKRVEATGRVMGLMLSV